MSDFSLIRSPVQLLLMDFDVKEGAVGVQGRLSSYYPELEQGF